MPKVATTCRSACCAADLSRNRTLATNTINRVHAGFFICPFASKREASGRGQFRTLFQQFDVTDSARSIPGPPDAVRIARIDLDSAMILFCVSEREFCKGPRRRIETRNQIGMLLAEPDQFAFRIALDGIRTGVLSWRIEEGHLGCLVVHLH